MFKRLQAYLHKFVYVRQSGFGRGYAGRLMHVDDECVEIQAYKSDGTPGERWTVNMSTITDFVTDSEQLNTLALKVQWALSSTDDEAEGLLETSREQTGALGERRM